MWLRAGIQSSEEGGSRVELTHQENYEKSDQLKVWIDRQGNQTRTILGEPPIHEGGMCHANEVDLVEDSGANWAFAESAC